MSGELCTLHNYALALRQINMLQVAGDFDYLVAWLKSPEWTGGHHLKPDPAGKNTVDAYSNNCPIPYTACRKLVDCCTSLYVASGIVNSAKSLIQSLLTIYKSEVEQIAIKVYLDYVDDLIYLIDGVEPGPTPPPPEPYLQLSSYVKDNDSNIMWCPFLVGVVSSNLANDGIVAGNGMKGYLDTYLFRCARISELGRKFNNDKFYSVGYNLVIGWDPLNNNL